MLNYLKSNRMKLSIGLIAIFLLFQVYKFISVRIINLDLPKGKIVFSSSADGDDEIYIMDINGTNLRQLTHNPASKEDTAADSKPSFSPDGIIIVFTSSRQGKNTEFIYDSEGRVIGSGTSGKGTSDIYIMDSEGNNQIPLTYGEINSHPFFSPDNRKIVFRSIRPSSTKMLDIYSHEQRILNHGGGQFEFSKDGMKLYDNLKGDISVTDITGINRVKLTNFLDSKIGDKENKGLAFNLSSDGKRIVIFTKESRGSTIGEYYDVVRFYTMNIDGSNFKEIYKIDCSRLDKIFLSINNEQERFCSIEQYQYSPDGKSIIFIADFTYNKGIYVLNLLNGRIRELTQSKINWAEILDFVYTPDGRKIIFIADIYPKFYVFHALILRNIRAYINYYLFRKSTSFYDNKYLCIMDLDGKNYRKIAKLPEGTELGRDFIHWEK